MCKLVELLVCISGVLQIVIPFFMNRDSTIILENNQYKNMVIAIHDSVTENKSLLETLKETMTGASKFLYNATRHRAYFKEITILLPPTWSHDASYSTPLPGISFTLADVIITNPIRGKRSLPVARSYEGCGHQGVHILLTEEFLNSPEIEPFLNFPGKYFIHAFAQFRWGVFQEYAEEGEPQFYRSMASGLAEAIRCVNTMRGMISKNESNLGGSICRNDTDEHTGLYIPACKWFPYPRNQRLKASIMDHQYIQEIETFCDDNLTNFFTAHNVEAPSKHNHLCSHRSTWDVITKTRDFIGNNNPPIDVTNNQLVPTFTIMHATSRKRRAVVVFDRDTLSKSEFFTIIARLLHETSDHDFELALLHVGSSLRHKRSVNSTYAVWSTIDAFFGYTQSNTGLNSSVLQDDGQDHDTDQVQVTDEEDQLADASHIIFLNTGSKAVVQEDLVKVRHVVPKVSVLNLISTPSFPESNIDSLQIAGRRNDHHVLDILRTLILQETALSRKHVLVIQDEVHLTASFSYLGRVDVDSMLSSGITFIFHYKNVYPTIKVISPSKKIFDKSSVDYTDDEEIKLIKIRVPFIEVGEWIYLISHNSTEGQTVSILVSSTHDEVNNTPLMLRSNVKMIEYGGKHFVLHLDATQDSYSVVGLNVTAVIETERPEESMIYIQLLDNGAGADISKDDGIYSRYFTQISHPGAYHVTFMVQGTKGQVFIQEETFQFQSDEQPKKSIVKRWIGENFTRHITGNFAIVPHFVMQNIDITPPSRVVDLHAVKHIQYRNTIVLTWTAPGDDLDHGKCDTYELFVGHGIRDIRKLLNFTSTDEYSGPGYISVETLNLQSIPGETVTFLWTIKGDAKGKAFAVKAIDKTGNKGDISNVATTVVT